MSYDELFRPIQIGTVTVKNRIAMNPMGTRLCPTGRVNEAELAWSEERARGGLGLMITGGALVHPTSNTRGNPAGLVEGWHEDGVEGQARRVAAVQKHGCKVFGQMLHLGRDSGTGAVGGLIENPVLAPSPVRSLTTEWGPKEMEADDIEMVIAAFANTARLFRASGMDGIEIHGAHGYLIGQFLSGLTNHRSDAYGARDHDSRMKFLLEVLGRVRGEVGDDMPIGVRLSATEEIDGGITVDDTCAFAERLEASGLVQYLHLTVGVRGAYCKDSSFEPGFARPFAEQVRRATGLPLLLAGRMTSPAVARDIVADGVADLVGLGRTLIADPEWPRKVQEQKVEQIRPCLAFGQDCRLSQGGATCAVNQAAGRETSWSVHQIEPAPERQRIVVVGGGPAGLESARLAAERGLDVVLLEEQDVLGGQLLRAARAPHRDIWLDYVRYLEHEVRRLGVQVQTGVCADGAAVSALAPDVVLVATGSRAPAPAWSGPKVLSTWDLVDGTRRSFDGPVTVIDDGTGFWEVCGAADLLAAQGAQIDVVTPNPVVGRSIPHESVAPLHRRLLGAGARYHTHSRVVDIPDGGVEIEQVFTRVRTWLAASAVVVQVTNAPVRPDLNGLDESVPVHVLGDAVSPRRLTHATLDANTVVRGLGNAQTKFFHPTSPKGLS